MNSEEPRRDETGSAMIIGLLVTLLLFLLGTALLGLSETESQIAANDQYAEGAFQAAEAAVQVALDQLSVSNTDGVIDETDIGGSFAFRSGGREDGAPQPPQLVTEAPGRGFALTTSTGYNRSGYSFQVYAINGTGTGPQNTTRQVEVQVEVGPVAE